MVNLLAPSVFQSEACGVSCNCIYVVLSCTLHKLRFALRLCSTDFNDDGSRKCLSLYAYTIVPKENWEI